MTQATYVTKLMQSYGTFNFVSNMLVFDHTWNQPKITYVHV